MYTQCPDCSSVYEISTEELGAAGGLVRCGNCDATFNALRRLTTTFPEGAAQIAAQEDDPTQTESASAEPIAEESSSKNALARTTENDSASESDKSADKTPPPANTTEPARLEELHDQNRDGSSQEEPEVLEDELEDMEGELENLEDEAVFSSFEEDSYDEESQEDSSDLQSGEYTDHTEKPDASPDSSQDRDEVDYAPGTDDDEDMDSGAEQLTDTEESEEIPEVQVDDLLDDFDVISGYAEVAGEPSTTDELPEEEATEDETTDVDSESGDDSSDDSSASETVDDYIDDSSQTDEDIDDDDDKDTHHSREPDKKDDDWDTEEGEQDLQAILADDSLLDEISAKGEPAENDQEGPVGFRDTLDSDLLESDIDITDGEDEFGEKHYEAANVLYDSEESEDILIENVDGVFDTAADDKKDYRDLSNYLKPQKSFGRRLAEGTLALSLAALLGAQYVHHNRQDLATSPKLGIHVHNAYRFFGKELDANWNVSDYRIARHTIVPDSEDQQILLARATVINNSAHPRPLPLLRLDLKNRWGDSVYSRVFEADEYLTAKPPPQLTGSGRLEVALDLVNPTEDAEIGYTFEVCLAQNNGKMQCANDKVFDK